MEWQRFVAVGDSFTEGLEDQVVTGGRHLGWADRLAAQLAGTTPDFHYANLAIRGQKLPQIVGYQVPRAVALQPDLISLAAGVNDVLRPRFDLSRSVALLEAGVATARSGGADVLLVSFGDPSRRSRALGTITARLRDYRVALLAIGQQYDCYVCDLWHETVFDDPRLWAEDRLHLNADGHRRMAGAAAQSLGLPTGDWRAPLAEPATFGVLANARADVTWTTRHLGPWLGRRLLGRSSGDGLQPKRARLLPMDEPVG